jgi:hypothetical protein
LVLLLLLLLLLILVGVCGRARRQVRARRGAGAVVGASRCGRGCWRAAVMLQLVRDGELVPHGVRFGPGTLEKPGPQGVR